ncbi:DUF4418 family protein [Pelotomaculum propionicicum]|uniref:DUF4418 family protein n=1 Tax=Pelotomaculum propionicicum TaxID=258475 RepID=UPI003B7D8449
MNKKWKILSGFAVFLCLTLLIIPKVFPACKMMIQTANASTVPMCCRYAYQVELLVSMFALLVAGSLFFIRGAEGRRLGGLFLVSLSLSIILVLQPWVIGTCSSPDMPCNKSLPWFYSAGTLLMMTGVVLAWLAPRSAAEQNAEKAGRLAYNGKSGYGTTP